MIKLMMKFPQEISGGPENWEEFFDRENEVMYADDRSVIIKVNPETTIQELVDAIYMINTAGIKCEVKHQW